MPILSYLIYVRFSYYVFGTSKYSCPAQLVNRYTVGERSGARSITQTCPFLRGFVAGQYNERIEIPSLVIYNSIAHVTRRAAQFERGARLATVGHPRSSLPAIFYSCNSNPFPEASNLFAVPRSGDTACHCVIASFRDSTGSLSNGDPRVPHSLQSKQ